MAGDLYVLQSQRNEILSRITVAGLDPREFRWEHIPSSRDGRTLLDRLIHVPSGFFYEFDNSEGTDPGKHQATFSPGDGIHTERRFPGHWDYQMAYVTEWLGNLKRELNAPPLWERLAQGEPLLEVPLGAAEDSPFRPGELLAIEAKLDEVREYLARELPPEKLPTVQAQLDRLGAAAKTSGRLSWLQMAIGVMFTLMWGGMMAPDQARTVLQMIGQAFQRLIGAG